MAENPAEKLGKYTLEQRIAVGGMAEVFLATDGSPRPCVIKRMLPGMLIDPQFARMFLDEAKLVVQLNHRSIAQVYDFGLDKGVLYLAMEWVDGTNLRRIVKDFARRGAKIPVEHCARLVSQAALALGYAHRAAGLDGKPLKIIHRDVSPQNILLARSGAVKLIDFGVAKATSASQKTAAGMIKGKFAYMSPEQLRGAPLDGRSDIYGLGMVLYELLAAERAIPGTSEAEIAHNALERSFAPILERRPEVPPPLVAILARALASEREHRYDTAEDLAAELEAFITARTPGLSGPELATLIPPDEGPVTLTRDVGSSPNPIASRPAAPTAQTDSDLAAAIDAVPTKRHRASGPQLLAVPWAPVAKTVINPPGLTPRQVATAARAPVAPAPAGELLPEDLRVLPRSRLRWFLAAASVAFLLAAAAWWSLQGRAQPPTAAPIPVGPSARVAAPPRADPAPTPSPPP